MVLAYSWRMELEITVTVEFCRWFCVNFQALRKGRALPGALQRLTRRRHMHFLRDKIFRFRQAQQFIALVGLSFCYFKRTCRVKALTSSPHPSTILNVFSLIMIETISRGCFSHAQNNHVSTMIRAMHCLMWTLFITKHVSFVIGLIMFRPTVNLSADFSSWLVLLLKWIDRSHKWRPRNYSFVFGLIILSSLTSKQKLS